MCVLGPWHSVGYTGQMLASGTNRHRHGKKPLNMETTSPVSHCGSAINLLHDLYKGHYLMVPSSILEVWVYTVCKTDFTCDANYKFSIPSRHS